MDNWCEGDCQDCRATKREFSAYRTARSIIDCALNGEFQRKVATASPVGRLLLEMEGVKGWRDSFDQRNAPAREMPE